MGTLRIQFVVWVLRWKDYPDNVTEPDVITGVFMKEQDVSQWQRIA